MPEREATTTDDYAAFLDRKTQMGGDHGFSPISIPDYLFDFQSALVEWAVAKGRAAIFADCGLGKTPMELVWADNVCRYTRGRVLILTPLAVAHQTEREARKFGIEARVSNDGSIRDGITIANYEKLQRFSPSDFEGVVCDESSILKSFSGATRAAITVFMRKVRFRLLATATAAPNDYVELGTSSEALGYLGHMDMLGKFFRNEQGNSATGRQYGEGAKWRLKGHAEVPFWRWVCSWARAIRKPSDLGFGDGDFVLPGISQNLHVVESRTLADGMLFALPAVGLAEQREERRRTIPERCEAVAHLIDDGKPAFVLCHLNEEANLLERMIPDATQVSGSHSDDEKERRLMAFADGGVRVLVTKPKIGALGLNLQHCAHVVMFPSYSYEQFYQGVRRCWRFGQTRKVRVDIVATEGERDVLVNLKRKADQADAMFSNLVSEMNRSMAINRITIAQKSTEVPTWL